MSRSGIDRLEVVQRASWRYYFYFAACARDQEYNGTIWSAQVDGGVAVFWGR